VTPINSSAPELAVTVTPDWPRRGAQIFFVSVRGGAQDIWQATWEAVPAPGFSATPPAGRVPLEVTFDAGASNTPAGTEPLSFIWDFGDGAGAEGTAATHTFTDPARFAVTLTATNSLGISHSVERTVTASCPPGDVAPWTAADVGEPLLPGSAWKDGEDISVCAGGAGFLNHEDDLYFVHRAFVGDFVLSLSCGEAPSWSVVQAGVGLMVRASLDADAPYVAFVLEKFVASVGQRLRYRESVASRARLRSGPAAGFPFWLRLERSGDVFIARASTDGAAWEEVDRQEIPGLPASLLAGLVACGKDSGVETRAFTALQARVSDLTLDVPADGILFMRGDANADGRVDIGDAISVLGYLFGTGDDPSKAKVAACLDAADANDDGAVDIADAIATLSHLFAGAGPLPPPFFDCGIDPTEDGLDCISYGPCQP